MRTQNNRPLPHPLSLDLLFLGLTLILVGYFLVWLPGPSAGLQIIGIEMGEWIKFLGATSRRDLFYLPPVVMGLTLALMAARWPNDRFSTWGVRALAIAVAMLSFPAVAAIQLEPRSEWLARLLLIGLVCLVAIAGPLLGRRGRSDRWIWISVAVVAMIGAILPAYQYLAVRPAVEEIMRQTVGLGPGIVINAIGSLLIAVVALTKLWGR